MAGIIEAVKEGLANVGNTTNQMTDYATGQVLTDQTPSEGVDEIRTKTSDTYEAAKDRAEEMKDSAKDKAADMRDKAYDMKDSAQEKTSDMKDKASSMGESVKEKAGEMYDAAKQKASDLSGAAKVKADEMTSEDTKEKARNAADTAGSKLEQAGHKLREQQDAI